MKSFYSFFGESAILKFDHFFYTSANQSKMRVVCEFMKLAHLDFKNKYLKIYEKIEYQMDFIFFFTSFQAI